MQRIYLFTLLLLLSFCAISQNPYIKFVEKASVNWAGYAHDTFRFAEVNLNLLLRDQLTKNNIEARITDYNTNTEVRVSLDSIKERISPSKIIRLVDNDGKVSEEILKVENQLYDNTYFTAFTNNLMSVQQVIYLQDGKLLTHIPWVSPMYDVVTTMGTRLGISNVFQTAFNEATTIKKRWKRNAIYLGNTSKKYTLNPSENGLPLLKPLYGNNLLQALWPNLNSKKFTLTEPASNALLSFKDVSMFLLDSSIIEIPIYDEMGDIATYKKLDLRDAPLQLDSIPFVLLEQEWFYIPKQNKLYSQIISIECWAKKITAGKLEDQPSPILKIIQAK